MSIKENAQTARDFFAAMGRGDRQGLMALSAEDIEMIPFASLNVRLRRERMLVSMYCPDLSSADSERNEGSI